MPSQVDVHIDNPTVRPNGSFTVEILDEFGVPLTKRDDLTVSINGVPVSRRTIQAPAKPGKHDVSIRVSGDGINKTITKTITVAGKAITFARKTPHAIERVPATLAASFENSSPYTVAFNIGTAENSSRTALRTDAPSIVDIPHITGRSRLVPPFLTAKPLDIKIGGRHIPLFHRGNARIKFSTDHIQIPDIKTGFSWNFGDGSSRHKQGTHVVHDYSEAIDPQLTTMTFDVACTLPAGDVVQRTLVLHSAYGIARNLGSIVPMTSSPLHATATPSGFAAPIALSNIEYQNITITHMSVTPHHPDPHSPAVPRMQQLHSPITMPPRSDTVMTVLLESGIDVPEGCAGFTLTFSGSSQRGLPVRFSSAFDVAIEDRGIHTHLRTRVEPNRLRTPFDLGFIHGAITDSLTKAKVSFDKKTTFSDGILHATGALHELRRDKAGIGITETLAEAVLHADITKTAQSTKRGTTDLKTVFKNDELTISDVVAQGETCDPDNTSTEDAARARAQGLVCQLTDEELQVEMPARFLNARKGDIILSPGGAGLIGSLLRRVTPQQLYSHCGIMTRNYDEITHSTASIERLKDYKVGFRKESDGYSADAVKYMWPGVVAQSVEAAVNGEPWVDPDNGRTYTISSFSPYEVLVTEEDVFELVPPLVLKPQPDLETPQIRAKLHEVADAARADAARPGENSRSHYRLFAYTDPAIADTDVAPQNAGWAAGTYPSVCSSFIWHKAKSVGIPLETTNDTVMVHDLEAEDLAQGAQVFPDTKDGLYAYSADERLAAGQWLFDTLKRMVLSEASWVEDLLTDASNDIANQILNAFALDTTDKDSTAWRDAKAANAVSPDNLMWWDGPNKGGMWGFVEPAQYRPMRTETYRVSRWHRSSQDSKVEGIVRINGRGVASAEVRLTDELRTRTRADGSFTITNVPLGNYQLRASVMRDGTRHSARVPVVIDEQAESFTINLAAPPERYRQVRVNYDFKGRDEEVLSDEFLDPGPELRTLELGPDRTTASFSRHYRWGGEVRAEYEFNFALLQDNSVRLHLNCLLYEGTSENDDDLDGQGREAITIAPGRSSSLRLMVTNTDEGDGDYAFMTVSVSNTPARN